MAGSNADPTKLTFLRIVLAEEGDLGVGVRFTRRKVTFVKNVRIDRFNRVATIPMCFAGEDFASAIDLDAVDDYHRASFTTDDEFAKAFSGIFHHLYAAAERYSVAYQGRQTAYHLRHAVGELTKAGYGFG